MLYTCHEVYIYICLYIMSFVSAHQLEHFSHSYMEYNCFDSASVLIC